MEALVAWLQSSGDPPGVTLARGALCGLWIWLLIGPLSATALYGVGRAALDVSRAWARRSVCRLCAGLARWAVNAGLVAIALYFALALLTLWYGWAPSGHGMAILAGLLGTTLGVVRSIWKLW